MSLLTMGYGHLTIITMGLGISSRIAKPVKRLPPLIGKVEFDDIPSAVEFRDLEPEVSFEEEREKVNIEDSDSEVSYD